MSRGELRVTSVSKPEEAGHITLSLYLCRVPAGFPSPAGDFVESRIDLNEWLVRNEPATFIVRVEGDSMECLIPHGDWLVVDCSLDARHGDVVLVHLGGEATVMCPKTVMRYDHGRENLDQNAVNFFGYEDEK